MTEIKGNKCTVKILPVKCKQRESWGNNVNNRKDIIQEEEYYVELSCIFL